MPQPVKPASFAIVHETPKARQAEVTQAPATARAPAQQYLTKVWIYLTHTGGDAGSTCEIHSEIYFDDANHLENYIEVSTNTDFSGNNGGLGNLLVTKEVTSRGFGKRFRATAYEGGNISTPDRMFVDGTIDFEEGPDNYMSGQLFTWGPFFSSSDGNYKGYIQFQCSPFGI
ncbi:hypothetical protein MRS44_016944 [Fusarium solani]|uniref:uncharacterized protein n=1 Tax=Fusarium solani TaxID=169388 RepID=UPI0032C3FDB9|nr:hypothetical protein MRS44_016944 [Fusarium solani]